MIARRIITFFLFILFFLALDLNNNKVKGWILLLILTAGFVLLFESGILKDNIWLKTASWAAYFGLFAAIFFFTAPPFERVPAALSDNIKETDVIQLDDGKVSGILDVDAGIEIYAGIPYAAPPVGELRWKEPQDVVPWEGVLKADKFAPMAMQPRHMPIYYSLMQIIGYHDYDWFELSLNYQPAVSEDALYLNIWKPEGDVKDLPVLVYVHGGSLQTGQTFFKDYNGQNTAKNGVIVVNMGYRLGAFGFLALKELAEESPNGTTGNYGLLDQIKALEWVRDNISSFGGDPSNVTLAGESAGAAAVSALCTSPLAKGLFRRVILESSTAASKVPPHSYRSYDDALKAGEAFKEKYKAYTLEELRALPAEKIVGSADTEHHITVDGYVLTEDPYVSYTKGIHNEEAALHGFNSKESGPFIILSGANMKNLKEKLSVYYGEYTDEVISVYAVQNDSDAAECWAEVYGATFFDYPHHVYNRLARQNEIPVYEYYFSKDNGRLGSWHAGELPYIYANLQDNSKLYDDKDHELMKAFNAYMINFVRNGDPNGEGLPAFEINEDSVSYLELGEKIAPVKEKQRKIELFKILDKINCITY